MKDLLIYWLATLKIANEISDHGIDYVFMSLGPHQKGQTIFDISAKRDSTRLVGTYVGFIQQEVLGNYWRTFQSSDRELAKTLLAMAQVLFAISDVEEEDFSFFLVLTLFLRTVIKDYRSQSRSDRKLMFETSAQLAGMCAFYWSCRANPD